ncbi:MAG TPA: hypothetical protein VGM10_11090 [Actinocrinis sp.]
MITCVIQYELDPYRIADFEQYAAAWPPTPTRRPISSTPAAPSASAPSAAPSCAGSDHG